MTTPRAWALAVLLVATACSSGGDGDGDLATFCERFRALADDNPFATLEVASPLEMQDALEQLQDAAVAMDEAAPDDIDRYTRDYRKSVDDVVEHLEDAQYDARNVDATSYRRATLDYQTATVALWNEANATCE